jgi:hypothetical protein
MFQLPRAGHRPARFVFLLKVVPVVPAFNLRVDAQKDELGVLVKVIEELFQVIRLPTVALPGTRYTPKLRQSHLLLAPLLKNSLKVSAQWLARVVYAKTCVSALDWNHLD